VEYTRTAEPAVGRGSPPGRRDPVPLSPNIRAVKDAARIEQVVQDYGEFRLVGSGRLLGPCVSPGHEDRTPSMSAYTDTQRFKCFGCQEGGDVLDLVVLAEGCELWEAMVSLSTRYGIELPGRPDSWYRKQERQKPARDAQQEAKIRHIQRRVFRTFRPMIWEIEDEDERREEVEYLWEAAEEIAVCIWAGRRSP
jgi:DNA primase